MAKTAITRAPSPCRARAAVADERGPSVGRCGCLSSGSGAKESREVDGAVCICQGRRAASTSPPAWHSRGRKRVRHERGNIVYGRGGHRGAHSRVWEQYYFSAVRRQRGSPRACTSMCCRHCGSGTRSRSDGDLRVVADRHAGNWHDACRRRGNCARAVTTTTAWRLERRRRPYCAAEGCEDRGVLERRVVDRTDAGGDVVRQDRVGATDGERAAAQGALVYVAGLIGGQLRGGR